MGRFRRTWWSGRPPLWLGILDAAAAEAAVRLGDIAVIHGFTCLSAPAIPLGEKYRRKIRHFGSPHSFFQFADSLPA